MWTTQNDTRILTRFWPPAADSTAIPGQRPPPASQMRCVMDYIDPGASDYEARYRQFEDAALQEQYARARETQADVIFDEMIEIADTPRTGIKKKTTASGVEINEGDMIEHRRLQIDARKWVLGKLRPKKYGDKTTVENVGPARYSVAASLTLTAG
jgi:hypothetical protein